MCAAKKKIRLILFVQLNDPGAELQSPHLTAKKIKPGLIKWTADLLQQMHWTLALCQVLWELTRTARLGMGSHGVRFSRKREIHSGRHRGPFPPASAAPEVDGGCEARTSVLVRRNQNGWQERHLTSRPNKDLPKHDSRSWSARLSHLLTVTTGKLIAPRLLDYLQPSCCFDHLKNEQACSQEVRLQESVELLPSSCRPTSCTGPASPWAPGAAGL